MDRAYEIVAYRRQTDANDAADGALRDRFSRLRDVRAKARILARIRRLELGNAGDAKSVKDGVGELPIDYGPGYRVYFMQRGDDVVLLLCGGDKSTQKKDIEAAKALAKELRS